MQSRCSRVAIAVWAMHDRGTPEPRPRHARDTVEVCQWCGRGMPVVRSRYARGAVNVRSWCGRGMLVVRFRYVQRCGSRSVRYFNFLTGGSVYVYIHILNVCPFGSRWDIITEMELNFCCTIVVL